MEFQLSHRMSQIQESATLKMGALAQKLKAQGIHVISFAVGEPDFSPPAFVGEAVKRAVDENDCRYSAVAGKPELRKSIARWYEKQYGVRYTEDSILVSTGAKQSIFNLLMAVVNDGDEVLIPAPYWVSYPEMVKMAGGIPVILETALSSGLKITPGQLKQSITSRTKVLILNQPSNPSGVVYTQSELRALAEVLQGTSVLVCSDEIYESLVYDGLQFQCFAALSQDAMARTVTISGLSKSFAMTGWRLGYACGPQSIIKAMGILQGQSTSNASTLSQRAALAALDSPEALKGSSWMNHLLTTFQRRRDLFIDIVSREPRVKAFRPQGAFYLWLDVAGLLGQRYNQGEVIATSDDLAAYLLESAHVATVPGTGFGVPNGLRCSYAVSDEAVKEGATRLVEAWKKLG